MIIRIRPLDTFFFRDGKPFSMGQETWADGTFPPSPSTLYGALRAIYFAHHPEEFKKVNTVDDPTRNLKINGIFLEIGEDIYLPVPADCMRDKNDNDEKTRKISCLLTIKNNHPFSKKADWIAIIDIDHNSIVEEVETHSLFKKRFYQDYLNSKNIRKINELPYRPPESYLQNEPKIAFKKSDTTGTIAEESLHRAGTQRFKEDNGKVNIVVEFEGLEMVESGFLKLGGEGKIAYYVPPPAKKNYIQVKHPKIESIKIKSENKFLFKICLATPALFKKGWLPSWINEGNLEAKLGNLKLKLLTAVVGKPILVGGFDMRNNEPKPMYKAVPAGSVYYFELLEGNQEEVINVFHQKSISDLKSIEGFGITYVGRIEYNYPRD